MHFFRHIGPALRAEIAQQAYLAATADSPRQLDRASRRYRNRWRRFPSRVASRNPGEEHARDVCRPVAPQADARRAGVGESKIHPAVLIKIERHDADGGRKIFFFEIDGGERSEFSFAGI